MKYFLAGPERIMWHAAIQLLPIKTTLYITFILVCTASLVNAQVCARQYTCTGRTRYCDGREELTWPPEKIKHKLTYYEEMALRLAAAVMLTIIWYVSVNAFFVIAALILTPYEMLRHSMIALYLLYRIEGLGSVYLPNLEWFN
jgi:hypothetical protein